MDTSSPFIRGPSKNLMAFTFIRELFDMLRCPFALNPVPVTPMV
jgi:hypothetical protein